MAASSLDDKQILGARKRADRSRRDSRVRSTAAASQVNLTPESSSQVWCDCSRVYESFSSTVTQHFALDAIRLARVKPGCDVLDVGAGTGAFAMAAARHGTEVLATDFSPMMIRRLQRQCASLAYQNVQTAVMDGQDLQLPDARFDVAASLFALMFFPDPDQGLSELYRVLRPGGQALVGVWAPPSRVELMRLMGDAVMTAGIEPPATDHVPRWLELCHAGRLRQRLQAAGFEKVHIVTVAHVSVFDEAEELASVLPASTPSSAALLASMTEDERRLFTSVLAEGFVERQGEGPYAVTNEAFIATATKPAAE